MVGLGISEPSTVQVRLSDGGWLHLHQRKMKNCKGCQKFSGPAAFFLVGLFFSCRWFSLFQFWSPNNKWYFLFFTSCVGHFFRTQKKKILSVLEGILEKFALKPESNCTFFFPLKEYDDLEFFVQNPVILGERLPGRQGFSCNYPTKWGAIQKKKQNPQVIT